MSHNDEEYNDSIMLSESLERIAAQAMHLKEKIEAGLQLPSWAEYKVYQAYDAVNKALGTAYPGRYEMEDKKASVFDLVKSAAAPWDRDPGSFANLAGELDPDLSVGILRDHLRKAKQREGTGWPFKTKLSEAESVLSANPKLHGSFVRWARGDGVSPKSEKKASVFDLVKSADSGAEHTDYWDRHVPLQEARFHEARLGPLRHMTADEAKRLRKSGATLTTPPAHIQAAYWKELARLHREKMGEKKASVFALLRAR